MATRSAIVKKNEDGSYTGIYCHWDGYPSHNGKILLENYNSQEKVDELIALGYISTLGSKTSPEIGQHHSFDNRVKDVTVAYHRDRGEDFDQMKGESLIDVLSKIDHEYAYVWIDGKWEVWDYDGLIGSIEEAIVKGS